MSDLNSVVISLASWEPRFLQGTINDIAEAKATKCVAFFFSEFSDRSSENLECLRKHCLERDVSFDAVELSYKVPLKSRDAIKSKLSELKSANNVLLDISTMTREIVWFAMDILLELKVTYSYTYWRPESTDQWTSKNSTRPRLVLGRAGESEYDKQTLIAVTTGFDSSRLDQMISYFEPAELIMFVQEGAQFENDENNVQKYVGYGLGSVRPTTVMLDSYAVDHGYERISNALDSKLENYNVVLASFGPKPSSIALHRFALENPSAALAYTPAFDFNPNYSSGIGEALRGKVVAS